MRARKPLILRIVIWICVVFMAVSLIWVYVVYMFSPKQEVGEQNSIDSWDLQEISWDVQVIEEILPEVNPDEPENTEAPILMTEEQEANELDQTIEVQLENGETEVVREWDLWDAIQINQ